MRALIQVYDKEVDTLLERLDKAARKRDRNGAPPTQARLRSIVYCWLHEHDIYKETTDE